MKPFNPAEMRGFLWPEMTCDNLPAHGFNDTVRETAMMAPALYP